MGYGMLVGDGDASTGTVELEGAGSVALAFAVDVCEYVETTTYVLITLTADGVGVDEA